MNTLLQTIKKGEEEFYSKFEILELDPEIRGIGDDILHWHKQFLISLLEVEMERLKNTYKIGIDGINPELEKTLDVRQKHYINAESIGYNQAIKDQISHIDEALTYLKRNV